jgi:hypothetical protein
MLVATPTENNIKKHMTLVGCSGWRDGFSRQALGRPGIDFQVWMPIVIGALGIYVLDLWKTDQFRL